MKLTDPVVREGVVVITADNSKRVWKSDVYKWLTGLGVNIDMAYLQNKAKVGELPVSYAGHNNSQIPFNSVFST